MLTICEVQMELLADREGNRFVAEAMERLRELFPVESEKHGSEGLPAWIKKEVINAKQYGLVNEVDVQRFLELLFHVGADIQKDPKLGWVRTQLENTGLTPEDRLDAVYSELLMKEG